MIRIKDLRQEKKLRQIDLASIIGVKQNTLSYWESGGSQPDNDTLKKLADYFDVSIDYLLGRTEIRKPTDADDDINYHSLTIGERRFFKLYRELSASDDPFDAGYKKAFDTMLSEAERRYDEKKKPDDNEK